MSGFFGLTIARRALSAQQQALTTVAHNAANANTPGYSRQEAVLVTTTPYTVPSMTHLQRSGQLGTGVEVATTRRLRDSFLDDQFRRAALALGRAEVRQDTLRNVESIYNEPSDTGLQNQLNRFWAAWQELGNDPSNTATRASVREEARALTQIFNRIHTQLGQVQRELDRQVELSVVNVNGLTQRIADLNTQIARVEATQNRANDLEDQRDLLLDELHSLLPVSTVKGPDGQVHIFLQGRQLVAGSDVYTLEARPNPANDNRLDLTMDGGASFLSLENGKLGGLLTVRDQDVARQLEWLDALAVALRDATNLQHEDGYGLDGLTGRAFFAGTGALDFALSADIEASLDAIAAAANGEGSGGPTNAVAIAALQNTEITVDGNNATPGDHYRAAIAELAIAARSASTATQNQKVLVHAAERQRQQISGVSLDEAAVQMIEFQRAYEAAARMVTAVDEMLDQLINRTGVIGR